MDPISAFLEIVDRVLELLKYRKLREDEFFEKVIQPLYESLPSAVEDMFSFLSETEKIIRKGNYGEEEIHDLRGRRQEFLTSRIQVRTASQEIAVQTDNPSYKEFATQVAALFSATQPNKSEDYTFLSSSVSGNIIDVLDQEISGKSRSRWNEKRPAPKGSRFVYVGLPDFDQSLLLSLELSRKRLESRWQDVSRSYARIAQNRFS